MSSDGSERFSGLFVPMVTPMSDGDMAVDDASLARFAKHLAGARNVTGIVTTARIGEGPVLTFDEQLQVARTVRSAIGEAVPVIATINPHSAGEARDQVRELAHVPVDAVMIFPPLFLAWGRVPSEVKVRFFEDVAADTPLPLVLFQTPVKSYWFSPEEARAIAQVPGVVGMKEASFDMQLFGSTLHAVSTIGTPFPVLNGNDHFVAEGAVMGAQGALIGIANVFPEAWGEILRLAAADDARGALALQRRLRDAQQAIFAEPILDAVARIKVVRHADGVIDSAAVRPPQLGLGAEERTRLLRTYETLRKSLAEFTA